MINPIAFKAPRYLRNAHVQTVLNSQGLRRLRAGKILRGLNTEILTLQADDGTRLLADFDSAAPMATNLAVLLHGWEGCSRSSYIVTTTERLLAAGYDVLRLNLRDHGDSHHLNSELFNSTRTPEVAGALHNYLKTRQYRQVFLAGFSLGGSFALRIAADHGGELGLDACIAVCPPIDPARAMDALNRGFFGYERYFFRRWHQSLQRKLRHFPELGYAEMLASAKSLDDLNRLFIPRYTIYADVDEYFAAYALVGDRLAALNQPTYLIAAEDDPIIPVDDLPRIDSIAALKIETQRHGGHCGFIENLVARSWVEGRILQILRQHETI